jgi:D-glucuronyl C5-epimerase C-terminus
MGVAQRIVLGVSIFAVVVLGFSSAAPAGRRVPPQKIALAAVARLQAAGRIDPADAARYRKAISRAVALIPRVPASRATPLRSQLAQAAAIAPKLTAPRALAVFSQLEVNDDWFANHGPAASQTDITDADGVVYRYFSGGFEFHPLGNFAALNADALAKNVTATTRLANALAERAVPEAAGGAGWEYYFDYGGGRAPWTSGFAQVVAAQSFARAAKVDTADSARLLSAARSAYHAVPGRLVRDTSFGPWIRLYSFNHAVVLNAQLQAAISLASYAKLTSDSQAGTLAAEMTTAAARALPSFTTGYWSYYELPGEPSPVSYQNYVVELLQTLARADDRFAPAATEFAGFGTKPPAFRLGDAGVGAVNFWVSKPSSVRVSALGRDRWLSVSGGWHTVSWQLPSRAGIFPVTIHATDWAGNGASVEALPIVRVVAPPKKPHKAARSTSAVAAASLPPLVVGAGLQQPAQAGLALSQGLGAVRMTLVWPTGASVPDPGAITALNRLPAGTNLVLDLYLSAVPPDSSALAAYAASVAAQVPALRDLIVGPGPGSAAESAGYVAALAAVYDAVKAAAPAVRVAGALDGSGAPKASLVAMAAALKASGRAGPAMDELAFTPAPAAGKNLWTLADVSKLVTALGPVFGSSLPLLIDDIEFGSEIPAVELGAYSSPVVGTTGLEEPDQAAAYAAALTAVACKPTVVGLLLGRLVDGTEPGQQSGLYYADGAPKTSLSAFAAAVQTAQTPSRGCTAGSGTPPPTPSPTPTPAPGPTPTPAPAPSPPTATTVADETKLAFPTSVAASSPPAVRLGCRSACLYLVTMMRAGDGSPVLARRGSLAHAGSRTVTLPKAKIAAGSYRFAVWIVGTSNPGPVTISRSGTVAAH